MNLRYASELLTLDRIGQRIKLKKGDYLWYQNKWRLKSQNDRAAQRARMVVDNMKSRGMINNDQKSRMIKKIELLAKRNKAWIGVA